MTPRKRIKNKLDKIFAKYIVARDKRCVTCGKTTGLQCSHFFGRRALSTRWDKRNSHAQCSGCHMEYHLDNTQPYTRFMQKTYGKELETLEIQHNTTIKYPVSDLNYLYKYYEKELKELT